VTIYEVGASDGTSFIAMELVEGKTLRELLASGPLPPRRLLPLAAQVASGLSRAHAAGIVHRDLKPENLMVTRDGLVKILDFGLAKLVPSGLDSDATNLPTMTRGTEAGTILGTVSYMSPEQASAEPLDFRSDQFAVRVDSLRDGLGKRSVPASHGRTDALGDHRGRAGAAGAGLALDADEPAVDRGAVLAKDPRGEVRIDEGPGAGSRDHPRPLVGNIGFGCRTPGLAAAAPLALGARGLGRGGRRAWRS
jgi:hypothetical protein